jgi:hypothetical protein
MNRAVLSGSPDDEMLQATLVNVSLLPDLTFVNGTVQAKEMSRVHEAILIVSS